MSPPGVYDSRFQAVNADGIDGDTLHHALGLTPFGGRKKTSAKENRDKKASASQRIAQWKWLIIDEISMVSANFLAELDMHLRQIMTDVSLTKKDTNRIDQAFGGINILFVGDFHQLDPPAGTPINAIPVSFILYRKHASTHQEPPTNTENIYFGAPAQAL